MIPTSFFLIFNALYIVNIFVQSKWMWAKKTYIIFEQSTFTNIIWTKNVHHFGPPCIRLPYVLLLLKGMMFIYNKRSYRWKQIRRRVLRRICTSSWSWWKYNVQCLCVGVHHMHSLRIEKPIHLECFLVPPFFENVNSLRAWWLVRMIWYYSVNDKNDNIKCVPDQKVKQKSSRIL